MLSQKRASPFVMTDFHMAAASGPVYFKDKPAFTAGEIGEVGSDRKLPNRLETAKPPVADCLPQSAFSFGIIPPQGACTFQRFWILVCHGAIKTRDATSVKRPSSALSGTFSHPASLCFAGREKANASNSVMRDQMT